MNLLRKNTIILTSDYPQDFLSYFDNQTTYQIQMDQSIVLETKFLSKFNKWLSNYLLQSIEEEHEFYL